MNKLSNDIRLVNITMTIHVNDHKKYYETYFSYEILIKKKSPNNSSSK